MILTLTLTGAALATAPGWALYAWLKRGPSWEQLHPATDPLHKPYPTYNGRKPRA